MRDKESFDGIEELCNESNRYQEFTSTKHEDKPMRCPHCGHVILKIKLPIKAITETGENDHG